MNPNANLPIVRLRRPNLIEAIRGESNRRPMPTIRLRPAEPQKTEKPAQSDTTVVQGLKQLRSSRD